MLWKRKGLGEVVATTLIVALSVVAVIIIAQFVVPFIKNGLNDSSKCMNYNDYFYFDQEQVYNCRISDTPTMKTYAVSVGAKSADNATSSKVAGFKLLFMGDGTSQSVEVVNLAPITLADEHIRLLDTTQFTMKIPDAGEVRTYVYRTASSYTKVSVYPVLADGKMCDPSDTIALSIPCDTGVTFDIRE